MVTLNGCKTPDSAKRQGTAQAGVTLADWPDECRRKEAHAALTKGEDIRVILKRERAALDRANGRVAMCASFYDRLKANL